MSLDGKHRRVKRMANRVLRDWTDSEAMDTLSPGAEVFFTRLVMKADDYGSYHANPKLIRAGLFPLKAYTDVKVGEWLDECITAGLVFTYVVDGRKYIRIKNFGQRLRNMRNTFPKPLDDDPPQVAASVSESPPETETKQKRNETESETEMVLPHGDLFLRSWDEWIKYRSEKRQKLTSSSRKKQIELLAARSELEACEMIQQSIANGWTGLFEVKRNGSQTPTTSKQRADPMTL